MPVRWKRPRDANRAVSGERAELDRRTCTDCPRDDRHQRSPLGRDLHPTDWSEARGLVRKFIQHGIVVMPMCDDIPIKFRVECDESVSRRHFFSPFRAAELALRFAGLSPRQGVTLTFESTRYQRKRIHRGDRTRPALKTHRIELAQRPLEV